jgi:hypothetical protein
MRRSGKGSGGGAGMNKVVSPGYKVGQSAKAKNVKAVSQVGQSLGNHVTDRRQVVNPIEQPGYDPIRGVGQVPLGNETSKQLSGANAGPGKGRDVMPCGAQGQHGSVNPGQPTHKRGTFE